MKSGDNINIQLILFPGISVIGLAVGLITKNWNIMVLFYGISALARAVFSFLGNIYGHGHWFSKKECILDGLLFVLIGMVGEIELILYLKNM